MNNRAENPANDIAQCTLVEAGERWREPHAASQTEHAQGALLTTEFAVFEPSEVPDDAAGARGEEVVAILEGKFDIDAAVSPDGSTVVVTDPTRQTVSLVANGAVTTSYGNVVGTTAAWSPDSWPGCRGGTSGPCG